MTHFRFSPWSTILVSRLAQKMRDWKANKYLLIIALACLNIGIGVLAEDAQFIELYGEIINPIYRT